jgi:hypothetical protein
MWRNLVEMQEALLGLIISKTNVCLGGQFPEEYEN